MERPMNWTVTAAMVNSVSLVQEIEDISFIDRCGIHNAWQSTVKSQGRMSERELGSKGKFYSATVGYCVIYH